MIKQIIKISQESYSEKDYKYHILPVVKNALLLGKKLKADLKVVEIAAYLHDIGKPIKREEFVINNEHHLIGAKEANKILKDLDFSEEFINKVEHCVISHRGRKGPAPETLEAEIVACADAMAHFDTFLDLFNYFLKTSGSFEESVNEIEKKMERNWNKKLTLPLAKEIVRKKYNAILLLIKTMKEYF
jgi:uncharacterized protein